MTDQLRQVKSKDSTTLKLLKEPLFHFLLIGLLLFIVFDRMNNDEIQLESQIRVSEGRIDQLASVFARTWQRQPTQAELQSLIDDYVIEEIYYRQAKAIGIDRDDTIIRRRLRQKFEFLTEDMMAASAPGEAELRALLESNGEKYRRDNVYSFEQVYINPQKHGKQIDDVLESQLQLLQGGQEIAGDGGLLQGDFESVSSRNVNSVFGLGFAAKLDDLPLNEWQGPIESGLGFHFIRLKSYEAGSLPELEDIRSELERDWSSERSQLARQELNEELKKQYEVIIEWPDELVMAIAPGK